MRYYAARYPYQLDLSALQQFNAQWFSDQNLTYDEVVVSLPCDQDGVPIPSPWIADILAMRYHKMAQWLPWTLCVAKLENAPAFFAALKHHQLDLNGIVTLASDAQYWISVTDCGSTENEPGSACLTVNDVACSESKTAQHFW